MSSGGRRHSVERASRLTAAGAGRTGGEGRFARTASVGEDCLIVAGKGAMAGRVRRWALVGLTVVVLLGGGGAAVLWQRMLPVGNGPQEAADYRVAANWACLPGRADSCAADMDATAVAPDLRLTRVTAPAAADAAVDCFYVYPTVSRARTANAPLAMDGAVDYVLRAQFARFRTVCRTYAPLYRQKSLRSILAATWHVGVQGDDDLAYRDVRDAWLAYLAAYNAGRGVVLIGHSQGARMLKRLVREEIDGKPVQGRLVSAILLGHGVAVPVGRDVGGDFQHVPVCRAAGQTQCVISYASFRASSPPPAGARFGIDPWPGMAVVCANPAALAGGRAALDSFVPVNDETARAYVPSGQRPGTPYIELDGLFGGECVRRGNSTFLAISPMGAAGDKRGGVILGDLTILGHTRRDWGLHLIDVNVAQGDLVRVVAAQAAAFGGGK